MILLLLLSLLAGDTVKVHRNPPGSEQWLCRDAEIQGKPCWVPEHYFTGVVTDKCDTVVYVRSGGTTTYFLDCHPETTLVDSGGYAGPGDETVTIIGAPGPTVYVLDSIAGLDLRWLKEAMPDLKEMLREWRIERCYKHGFDGWGRIKLFGSHRYIVRDSCECVYQRKDGK